MTDPIDNTEDIIDSRDVIERIAELDKMRGADRDDHPGWLTEDEWAELQSLRALAEEASGYAPDWEYGEALIRDSYFTEYAEQLADDIGAINRDASWPICHIDWEAAAESLKVDYSKVTFDGVTYWVR